MSSGTVHSAVARLIDISRPLSPATAAWPGDTPTSLRRVASLGGGASVNLSTLTASLHAATHADAPLHYDDAGPAVEDLDLSIYLGPCRVVDVRGRDPIAVDLLPQSPSPRLLLKTGGWSDSAAFPADFPVLEPVAATVLGERGVRLLGVDVPSVDKPDSKSLPVHHALHKAGMLILEGLDLSNVEPGDYELIALPVLIPGGDGAFVRAVLRTP